MRRLRRRYLQMGLSAAQVRGSEHFRINEGLVATSQPALGGKSSPTCIVPNWSFEVVLKMAVSV